MIENLGVDDIIMVVVREGDNVPYIAGKNGEYIHIEKGDYEAGQTAMVRVTEINGKIAKGVPFEGPNERGRNPKNLIRWSDVAGFPVLKTNLQQMDPFDFEEFIAELWREMGWEASSTSGSGDGGIDVIVTKNDPVKQKHLIQVKRYGPKNTIGTGEIREYGYILDQHEGDVGIVVTTSKVSQMAKDEAEMYDLRTIDGDELCSLIREYDAEDIVRRYVS